MSSYLRLRPNPLSYVHCYRLRVSLDLLDAWRTLAQTVSSVIVDNDVDSVFDVKVQKVRIILDLFSILSIRTAQDHSWLPLVIDY